MESAEDVILITDREHQIVWANQAFSKLFGIEPQEAIGANRQSILSLVYPNDSQNRSTLIASPNATSRRELIRVCLDGSVAVSEETVTPLLDDSGNIGHFLFVLHDITQIVERSRCEQLRACQDALTGLASRAHVLELLHREMKNAQRSRETLALLFIDLDVFKRINDTFGHHVGDAVLQAAASRIQGAVRCTDTVGRYGGDEFLILLPIVSSPLIAERIAQDVLDQMASPISVQHERIYISASIGVALFPECGVTPQAMLISADTAMYRAKRSGGNQVARALPSDAAPMKQVSPTC